MGSARTVFLPLLLLLLAALFFASGALANDGFDHLGRETEDGHYEEVVVRIPAPDPATRGIVVNALAALGHGPDCLKGDRPFIEAKIPAQLVPQLKASIVGDETSASSSSAAAAVAAIKNLTIIEDPVRAEYERFVREAQHHSRRAKRADPFADLYDRYHSSSELHAFLEAIATAFPGFTRLYSIGESSRHTPLWVLQITDNPWVVEDGEPQFHYIANMHGDEVVGRELSLYFIYHLCSNYDQPRIKALIDNVDIHIMPTLNPDGYDSGRRGNGRGKDLNRNFPDQHFEQKWGGSAPLPPRSHGDGKFKTPQGIAIEWETVAVMQWMGEHNFALGANFHGGSVVANYPYDGNANQRSGVPTLTPDDDIYKQLAITYATSNEQMAQSREFTGGITNGAEWYVLYGGMQDYSYLWHGTMHITVELSEEKWPKAHTLTSFWRNNKESMLAYLEFVNNRVWGIVTDCDTGARITDGYVIPSIGTGGARQAAKLHSETGNYHRVLPKPTDARAIPINLAVTAPGYISKRQTASFDKNTQMPLRVDICLQRQP